MYGVLSKILQVSPYDLQYYYDKLVPLMNVLKIKSDLVVPDDYTLNDAELFSMTIKNSMVEIVDRIKNLCAEHEIKTNLRTRTIKVNGILSKFGNFVDYLPNKNLNIDIILTYARQNYKD